MPFAKIYVVETQLRSEMGCGSCTVGWYAYNPKRPKGTATVLTNPLSVAGNRSGVWLTQVIYPRLTAGVYWTYFTVQICPKFTGVPRSPKTALG
jgi:hypothetical protein